MGCVHFADLDLAAIRRRRKGLDRAIVLWYSLHACNTGGDSRVPRADLRRAQGRLSLSHRHLQRLIRAGRNVLWTVTGNAVYLHSPARVAIALGVHKLRAAYRAPLSQLRGSVAQVRSRMAINAVAAIRNGKPVSVAAIQDLTSAAERTVQRWLRASGVRVHTNRVIVAPMPSVRAAMRYMAERPNRPDLRLSRSGRRVYVAAQIPNTLASPATGGTRSFLRRANHALKGTGMPSITPNGRPVRYRAGTGAAALPHTRDIRLGRSLTLVRSARRGTAGLWEPAALPGDPPVALPPLPALRYARSYRVKNGVIVGVKPVAPPWGVNSVAAGMRP